MTDPARGGRFVSEDSPGNTLYKKDFWSKENLQYSRPHYRLEKSARIINRIARGRSRTLLDVGCGPAPPLRSLLRPNIEYCGIDIAIHDPAPNLIEADFLRRRSGLPISASTSSPPRAFLNMWETFRPRYSRR